MIKLKQTIGRNYVIDPDDVRQIKAGLNHIGYYEIPDYGLTPYPDNALYQSIEEFQRDESLKKDGVIKPDGPTLKKLNERLSVKSQKFICTICGAVHGGVSSPTICHDCAVK